MRTLMHVILMLLLGAAASASVPPYKNASLPIPQRVADLLSRMTLTEMIHQLHNRNKGGGANVSWIEANYGSTGMGSIFYQSVMNITWQWGGVSTPLQALRARNALQSYMLNTSRLGIPLSFCEEGLHSGAWGGVIFPAPFTHGRSWNDSLQSMMGRVIALEARAVGADTVLSPVSNMFTDARFGRYEEGVAPDPTLASRACVAMVTGLQGGVSTSSDDYLPSLNASVIAQSKHAAAYGAAAGGLNSGVASVSNRTLHEYYLRPWRAMAGVGLRSLMVSHQLVNDIPAHGNAWLLTDKIRNDYGFNNGVMMSDENDVALNGPAYWAIADNSSHAAAVALRAGVDIDLMTGLDNDTLGYVWLQQAVDDGTVTVDDIANATARVLTMKFAAGLFDAPITPEDGLTILDSPAHRALALEAAEQGIVLLQNNGTLPFDFTRTGLRVAIVGPFLSCAYDTQPSALLHMQQLSDPTPVFCNARAAMLGSYSLDNGYNVVQLLPDALNATFPSLAITITQGASTQLPPNASQIAAAVAAVAAADVAIVVLGDDYFTCNEGVDRDNLDLPGGQMALLSALVTTSTPIILVLVHGRPMTFGPGNAVLSRLAAVVSAGRPGEMGAQAIVNVLSGAVAPSGRLTDSWLGGVGQTGSGAAPFLQQRNGKWIRTSRSSPPDIDGRTYAGYWQSPALPLFDMGFGLTYGASFNYTGVSVQVITPRSALPPIISGRASIYTALMTTVLEATVTVCNVGTADGVEVVQVYARDPFGGAAFRTVRFWKRLVGYTRIMIAAKACADVAVTISADDLAVHDDTLVLSVQPGTYIIYAGSHSRNTAANATVVL